jgi:hypothetical protein
MRRILSMVMQAPTIAVLLLSIAGYLSWLLVLSRQHFLIPSRNSCLISFFSRSLPPPLPLSMFYCLQLSAFHIARVIGYRRLLLAALAFAVHV